MMAVPSEVSNCLRHPGEWKVTDAAYAGGLYSKSLIMPKLKRLRLGQSEEL